KEGQAIKSQAMMDAPCPQPCMAQMAPCGYSIGGGGGGGERMSRRRRSPQQRYV
ncbi:hypothetical protein KIPB_016086, partial [Kipferlia bialata]